MSRNRAHNKYSGKWDKLWSKYWIFIKITIIDSSMIITFKLQTKFDIHSTRRYEKAPYMNWKLLDSLSGLIQVVLSLSLSLSPVIVMLNILSRNSYDFYSSYSSAVVIEIFPILISYYTIKSIENLCIRLIHKTV